ncbi:MAG TPA: site-specific integrase [Terriglobales bacterium]|nr:site-specific integrase [Terriglobales bacterium]
MANKRVRLVRCCVVNGSGKTIYCKPEITGKGQVSSEWVLFKGKKYKVPASEGRWLIRWEDGSRPRWQSARNMTEAITLQIKKQAELHAIAAGIEIKVDDPSRLRLEVAFDDFIEDQELLRRADKTVDAYRAVKNTFLKSCHHAFLDQVTRRDLLRYAEYLRSVEKLSDRTVHTRWTALMTVLKHHGIRGLTKRGDTPQYVEEEAVAYTQAELDALFKICKPEYHLLFTFYLRTAFRMKEVMFLKWSDINFETETVRVKAKPEYDFIPKRWHERSIPLEEGLLRRLEARKKNVKGDGLVFPTWNNKPNGKHRLALVRLAKRAGQDPEQFWLHKFRATAATNWLRAGIDVRTVQKLLGHRSLNSTLRYLAPLQTADLGKTGAWKAAHATAP